MKFLNEISYRLFLILSLVFFGTFGYAQEDCTNGIDDDGDGLIDLQDGEDCICGEVIYYEFVGDFENYTCCPTSLTHIDPDDGIFCLDDGWVPPTMSNTPDYYNTCDYVGSEPLPLVPMPIPSGEGAVGFASSLFIDETLGICMDNSMMSGETYNLSFYIGFNTSSIYNSNLSISVNIYGTEDCDNLPINTDDFYPCLSDDNNWDLIATIPVTGVENDSWLYVSTSFISNMHAGAIAFGMECNVDITQYHFLDDINISGNFIVPIIPEDLVSSGNCLDGITVELPNSTGPEFQWFLDGVAIPGATSNPYLITDASAEGEYQLMEINGNSCTTSNPIEIQINDDVINIDGVVAEIQCIFNNDGMIDISNNSPNNPYEYEWSNGSTLEDITGEGPGTYTVTVTDDYGCIGIESFIIPEPTNTVASITGDCLTGVFISIESFSGATYQWFLNGVLIPGAVSISHQILPDSPGLYHVEASNGVICTESDPLNVDIDLEVLEVGGEIVNLLCYGFPTGSIEVEADAMNPPLSYSWSNGETTQEIINLEAGIYTVTVTDANGCFGEMDFYVDTPIPFNNSLNVVQPDMGNPGSAEVETSGGTLPYTYAWNNGFDQPIDNNLAAGSYSITVTDANGCAQIFEFEIISDYMVSEIISDETCPGTCDGNILLSVDGSDSDYSIVWDNDDLSGFDPTQICSGVYSYTITDSNDSPYVGTATINALPEIVIIAVYEDTICANNVDVDISLSVLGGTSPYSFLWNTGNTNDTLIGVGPGIYSVEVMDFLGCIALDTFVIDSLPLIDLQFEILSTGCDGEQDGAIDLTINNGIEPFVILWSNDSISEDLIDLGDGWYSVTVTDSYGCIAIDSAQVNANSGIEVIETVNPVNCKGDNDGSISLEISGGEMPYDILWSNGEVIANIENLLPGLYDVTIMDNAGCIWSGNYEILLNSDIDIIEETEDNECYGGVDGSIVLTINNASSTYSIMWQDGSSEKDRLNLMAGEYSFVLIDSFGCEYLDDYIISEGVEITYQSIISEPQCNGATDGLISISPITGTFPFSYQWSNGDTVNQIEDLSVDIYLLTITDDNGCVKQDTFLLSENSDIEVTETIVNNLCYGENEGSIGLNIIGGSQPYNILWSSSEETELIENLSVGDYFVTIEDSNGCSSSYLYTVFEPDSLHIEEFIVLPLCHDDLGSIGVQGNGGIQPYTYLWSTGETASTIAISPSSTYVLTMTDMNLCTKSRTYIIEEITEIEIIVTSIIDPGSSNDDGAIILEVSGGTPPYIINWDNGQTGFAAINLGTGSYTATVVDTNGCIQTITIQLLNDPLFITGMATENLCFGDCEGQITLTIEGGSEPYTINWQDGQEGINASSLCNGEYQATIIDELGQEAITELFLIESPGDIIINGQVYDESCVETEDGAIAITADGGVQPFNYMWSNNMDGDSLSNLSFGEYIVTVVDESGCSKSNVYSIDDIPTIDVGYELSPISCKETSTTLSIISENSFGYSYLVNNENIPFSAEETTIEIEPGSYTLSYLINNSCIIGIDSFVIEELPNVLANINITEITQIAGELVTLHIEIDENGDAPASILWTINNPYQCIGFDDNGQCTSMQIVANQEETVEIVVIDVDGCESYLSSIIRIKKIASTVFIPNIFSPNNDSVNDEFIITSNIEDVYVNSFKIYDRWGNLVFLEKEKALRDQRNWDGYYKNQALIPGVYVYMLEVKFEEGMIRTFLGDVTLIR